MPTQLSPYPELQGVRAAVAAFAVESQPDGEVANQALAAVLDYALTSSDESLSKAIQLVTKLGDVVWDPRVRVPGCEGYVIPESGCVAHAEVRGLLRILAALDDGHADVLLWNGLGADLAWVPNGGGAHWLFEQGEETEGGENRLGSVFRNGDLYCASTRAEAGCPSLADSRVAAQRSVEHKVRVGRAGAALRVRTQLLEAQQQG